MTTPPLSISNLDWTQPLSMAVDADEPPRLLLIDDDPTSLRLAAGILGPDYTLIFATCGRDALDLVTETPELILLDYHLPDIDGLETCRRFKSDPASADTPVIFITADQDSVLEAAGLEAGAVDFVTKPYSAAVLRARVRTHIQLKRKTDLLARFAHLDGLTNVANRRSFDQMLAKEWRRAQRSGRPVSLIMIDADHFKDVNDTWGHQMGDQCLRGIAHFASSQIRRPADLLARYGGEEFVLLLPETDAHGARQLAEAIRAGIEAGFAQTAKQGGGPPLTVSLGCATIAPCPEDTSAALLQMADRNLYLAKSNGRNRVEPATDDQHPYPSSLPSERQPFVAVQHMEYPTIGR